MLAETNSFPLLTRAPSAVSAAQQASLWVLGTSLAR